MDEAPHRTVRIERSSEDEQVLELDGIHLAVRVGPDRGLRRSFALPLVRIGTGAGADLRLTDPTVSALHAEVSRTSTGFVLRDLGSTNGIKVAGARVRELAFEGELEVHLGQTRLEIRERVDRVPARLRQGDDRLGGLVGRSRAMREVFSLLRAAGPTAVTVLLTGESGTGKELAARAVHELSGRAGPMVVFDAGTADPQLIRSDLFGHTKGAFTGAEATRAGALREADGGTLFLDELGELPLELQAHLLRALETRRVSPVGEDRSYPVDVRVVAATNRDLEAMVRAGSFREDLYHRLAVLPIRLPPLRERAEDIPLVAEALRDALGIQKPLSPGALEAMAAHPWPGNVRALRNALERAAVVARGERLEADDLHLPAAPSAAEQVPAGELQRSERDLIYQALARHGGNKTAAARDLGIAVATLRRRLQRYESGEED